MKLQTISTGSVVTIAIFCMALIIFGVPFFLISFWDSFEHKVPYQIILVMENEDMESCDSDKITIIRNINHGYTLRKCGELGEPNQLIYILESEEGGDE
jgi:hypothetical protein